jgi:hypothetical protein
MPLFGPPDIAKLIKNYNIVGLIKAAQYQREPAIRRKAIEALTRIEKKPPFGLTHKNTTLIQRLKP